MKVSELTGGELDYWVAKAAGGEPRLEPSGCWVCPEPGCGLLPYEPSTNWAHGGPIIERKRINIQNTGAGINAAVYEPHAIVRWYPGPTVLIAAMRAYVASKFGEEVPERL